MKRKTMLASLLLLLLPLSNSQAQDAMTGASEQAYVKPTKTKKKMIYTFKTETSNGKTFDFAQLKGKVIVVVNTASKCGFTPEFKDLEELYKKYHDQGLEIVGFPSGDFADQELENGEKAAEFCKLNYGVTFPIMKKVHVNGPEEEAIFTYLKGEQGFAGLDTTHKYYDVLKEMFDKTKPGWEESNDIKWNFTKFLISRNGKVVSRYETTQSIQLLEQAIVEELKK